MNWPSRVLALDLETTGLSADYDFITQIGLAVMDGTTIENTFTSRVQPDKERFRVSVAALEAQIGDWQSEPSRVADWLSATFDAPQMKEVAASVSAFVTDTGAIGLPVVAHNMPFDQAFVHKRMMVFKSVFVDVQFPVWIDTLAMARMADPGRKGYGLDVLCDKYGLPKRPLEHDALQDAILAGLLYDRLRKGEQE